MKKFKNFLVTPTVIPKIKKSEKVENIEEQSENPKMSAEEIIDTFLDGRTLNDLDKSQLKILNYTLRRTGYEEVKPNN